MNTPESPRDPAAGIRFRPLRRHLPLRVPIDRLLPTDHPARAVEALVASLDFTELLEGIRARDGHPGRAALDPRMLFALWLYACVEGVSSARELAKLCRRDLAFLWLSGQTRPNHHTLADFYSGHADFLHAAFAEHVAALLKAELVTLKEITLDGRKVPASANKQSFHREPTLDAHRRQAEEHLGQLAEQRAEEQGQSAKRQAARRRAARERAERLARAVDEVRRRQQERAARAPRRDEGKPEEARASETDPDARKMKLAHGGYAPAYNVQTVADADTGLVVAARVTAAGSDSGQLKPMVEEVAERTGQRPERVLADGGYGDLKDIEALEGSGTEVYLPPKNQRQELLAGKDPYAAKKKDQPPVAAWRARMGTAAAQAVYRRRAPVAEGVHAQQSNRGWRRFRLRGLAKAGLEAIWQALAHNLAWLVARKKLPRLLVRAAMA